MKNEHEINDKDKIAKEPDESASETASGEGEFKLTVRKLEMPVRPRGVLAE
jgi:hypothetical protein